MMRMSNIKMTTTVLKADLLGKLRANLAEHAQIVREAREGYVAQAREALGKKLDQIREGNVVALTFALSPPLDYSEVYKTTIQMLEWSQDDRITLEADEFRQLVQDEWDWSEAFFSNTSNYSSLARSKSR